MKPKILVTRKILPRALDYLKDHTEVELGSSGDALSKEELIQKIADKEGLLSFLTDRIDKDVMAAAPGLKIIANCAVGFDNIDLREAHLRGILITNTPGILTEATADLTWALILAVARKIPQAERFAREGKFKGWTLDLFLGKDISGKRLGIIGMGRIGKAVSLRAQAFRMEVLYSDPHQLSGEEQKICRAAYLSLDDLLLASDIVSIHASLKPETHHLISKEKLALMKKDAILINVARGPIVDEKALAEALAKKQIWGAGLDVYEREPKIEKKLLSLENVVLLPHIGSATYETRLKMAMTAARNLIQGLGGERPENLVV